MNDLTDAMIRALEELSKGPAVKSDRTGLRKVQFAVAARLVGRDFATYDLGRGALEITAAGRAVLEQHRAGFR